MKHTVRGVLPKYSGFFEIEGRDCSFQRFGSDQFIQKEFEVLAKWNAVAVLIYNADKDALVLVRQFRAAATAEEDPFLLEIVAGGLEPGEDPVLGVKREAMEEAGYTLNELELISHFYIAPGFTTEKIALYYTEVTDQMKINKGGGLLEEAEDIQVVHIPVEDIDILLQSNLDAKTILAVQWFLLHKMRKNT